MLPSKKRLSRQEFDSFLKNSQNQVFFNDLGTLKYKDSQENKVSIVVSSKTEKRAVFRNKIRRRLYSLFENNLKITKVDPRVYVLYVSKNIQGFQFKDLKNKFDELFKKTTK